MFDFYFDENGHDVPHSPEEVANLAEDLFYQSSICSNDVEKARLLANAANCYRTIRKLDLALSCINQALVYTDTNSRSYYVYLLRKAHILQWLEKFDQALSIFQLVLDECHELEHFALQHRGKCYLDMKENQKATNDFERALAIRLNLRDKELIESSRHALEIAKKRLNESRE